VRNTADGINADESLWLTKDPSYLEVVAELQNTDVNRYNEIVFCGFGEPTERLGTLLKTAEYIKTNYPEKRIRLNTNGLSDLINERKTAQELAVHIDTVSISLNAANKHDYTKLCRPAFGEKSFDGIIEFTLEATRHFKKIYMSVVDVIPAEKIDECRKLCDEMGVELRIRAMINN
jgi:TatD family-associated radical SAM protein